MLKRRRPGPKLFGPKRLWPNRFWPKRLWPQRFWLPPIRAPSRLRCQGRRRSTPHCRRPRLPPPETGQAAPLDPPEPTLFADIDLGTQTMTVSDKNGEIAHWKISSARGPYRTPTGTFTPH
ncbi:MAG: L,D-transpeptidase [Hyphomicrobium sp.]